MFTNHSESYRPEGRGDPVAHQVFCRGFTEGGSLRSRPYCLGCENARVMVSPFWVCRFLLPAAGAFKVFVRHLVVITYSWNYLTQSLVGGIHQNILWLTLSASLKRGVCYLRGVEGELHPCPLFLEIICTLSIVEPWSLSGHFKEIEEGPNCFLLLFVYLDKYQM